MTEKKLTEVHGAGATRRLQTRTTVNAPIEIVWDALTKIEHVKGWWADGKIGSAVGESVQLGGEEDLNGSIVAFMKPHVFEFTWHDDLSLAEHPEWIEPATKSLVHFDLIELGAETTMLTLISFAPVSTMIGAAAGWHHILEMFKSYVETGDASSADDRFEQLKALYA